MTASATSNIFLPNFAHNPLARRFAPRPSNISLPRFARNPLPRRFALRPIAGNILRFLRYLRGSSRGLTGTGRRS